MLESDIDDAGFMVARRSATGYVLYLSLEESGNMERVCGSQLWNRKIENLPVRYLGLPLGACHNSVSVWDSVKERFRKRLAVWKRKYRSKEGRLTLMISILANMPIYTIFVSIT